MSILSHYSCLSYPPVHAVHAASNTHVLDFLLNWHLPSPSQTPTSTTFSSSSFVTPKINKFSSHFQDNFTTPSSGGQHTPVQTSNPFDYQSTPAAKPAGSGGQRRISFDDPGFHHNHVTADKGLQLPPVEITRRLSSSPNTPIEPQGESQLTQYPGPTLEGLAINNMDPTQMQTPPPTRDSSRRKTQQAYSAALNTPTIASRRTVAPSPSVGSHIPSAQIQPSPFALQFSPDMYQFSNTGPATAPVYSRTRPMWGQKDVLSSMNVEWSSAFDDPFMMPPQQSTDQSTWQDLSSPIHNQPSMPVPHTTSFPETTMAHPASSQWPQQARRDESYSQNTSLVEASPVTTGVNPSLLMSFSGHHSDPLFPETLEATLGADETRQPYAQQSQEFKRDQEAEQSVVARQHTRTSTSSSSGSLRSNFRPGLGRSNTIGGFKSVGRPTISTEDQISRTSSPLKRQSQGTLSSIPERRKSQRRSVVLTVDANGRASTETKLFPNVNLSEPRQRYPSLWDDSSSDSNSEDDADMTNRYSSTAFERSSERPRPAANSDIKDVSAIPRTSSASSNHAPWCSHNTSQASSNRVSWGSNASRRQSDSMNSSSQEDIGREDISRMDNSSGNAHSALREAMEGRVRKNGKEQNIGTKLVARSRSSRGEQFSAHVRRAKQTMGSFVCRSQAPQPKSAAVKHLPHYDSRFRPNSEH
ncbi:MAG: hypothetical protein M1820_005124 [Bogoriella megaspora]|nr:MAG: hypothetical protein M1820_005124 [Bogoriella megaspora]